jgi:hypothetical protein
MLAWEIREDRAMIRCPACGIEVEPFWEHCARCDPDVVAAYRADFAEPDLPEIRAPHRPPPYHGGRRSSGAASVTVAVLLVVTVALLALTWLMHPGAAAAGAIGL